MTMSINPQAIPTPLCWIGQEPSGPAPGSSFITEEGVQFATEEGTDLVID